MPKLAVRRSPPGDPSIRINYGREGAAMSARKSAAERIIAIGGRRPRSAHRGRVSIVGAGPGDPELLTVRALHRIESADVLVHDRLVDPSILAHARADARRIYVGKMRGCHAMEQGQINALLVDLARDGWHVVRLKGGDPFVFGRGGEELLHLRAHGIDAEIVPGVTAALGCAASAGVPVTHRDLAQAVTFVTGHAKDGAEPDLNWAALARANHTLVVYMGVATAGRVAARLIESGLSGSTPVAVVENGTRRNERVLTGNLAGLGALVGDNGIMGPAVLVIGEVAALADRRDLVGIAAAGGRAA
jgi:uroporphyrin-III C-methyltransferase / precorrin-2 dehydrogenase / sirohydrochlorin ferrochelatase